MPDLLAGKRVVVTGASRGLGRAFAVACGEQGASVAVNGRDEDALRETRRLVEETGARCVDVGGSVADYATCERIVGACVDAFGGVDCLVNNAGVTRDRTLLKMTPEEFDDVIAVNLRGSWACGKLAAAAMADGGAGGSIVNVVSNTGFQGMIGQSNYAASKAGVAGMTRTWTRELARYEIRVNAIWPVALTDMTQGFLEHVRRRAHEAGEPDPTPASVGLRDPAEVAPIVVFLASDASAGVTGQIISFDGRKLALWTHPREVNEVVRGGWDAETLAREFATTAGRELQPLHEAVVAPS